MDKIRVVIADDQSIIRDGLKLILEMESDLKVVGLASNGEEACEMAERLRPDIVLMDIKMPVIDGAEGTRRICEAYPEIKVIILTTFSEDEYIFPALRSGAKGYLLKDVESDELANSIRTVARGGVLIHPAVAARVVKGLSVSPKDEDNAEQLKATADLTPRELEIAKLIGKGMTNREIAARLFISEGTVKNHITNILSKLYLRDRTQIALYATQNKLV
ncbi:MAG TPA: response regulator transcription factor [Spirochaetia bacterium]|nr:response regulator transcription factor [Spirochaetia bacterium]